MNHFVHIQISNMLTLTQTFEEACRLGALKDDGKLSREEAAQLKKIEAAAKQFRKELESIK